jgi:succinyl-diaminopimelate desuccinylase
VCTTQKGALRVRVDVEGKMAHGAMPHQGANPVTALALFLAAMPQLERRLQDQHGEHPELGLAYITPTHVMAGSSTQVNVIPGDSVAMLDIRTVPGIDHPELVARLEGVGSEVGEGSGVTFELTVLVDRCPTETPRSDPVVQAVVGAHERVTGEAPPFGGVPGTTDGTILWRDGGLPVVVYGPGGKWIAHQADEYVDVADLHTSAAVYREAARIFLSGQGPSA